MPTKRADMQLQCDSTVQRRVALTVATGRGCDPIGQCHTTGRAQRDRR
jgi:hypothetical protein